MSFRNTLLSHPPWLMFPVALVLVGLVGWIDYATTWKWSVFAFYALPIALIVWTKGRRIGFAVAFLCAAIWFLSHIGSHPYKTGWGFSLAVLGHLFYYAVVVVAVAGVKARQERDQARIKALERAHKLEREILEIADREHERLGRELHDGLCQTLAGIAALSTTQARKLAANHEAVGSAGAAEITKLLHEAIREARDLAHGLGPLDLDEAGLDAALEGLAANVQRRFGVACTFVGERPMPTLSYETAMHLYRVAQQAVQNAVSHAHANQIEISLSRRGGQGLLSVTDNGVGLPAEPRPAAGIGLRSMTYRAGVIDGTFDIKGRSGGGTAVTCTFPWPETLNMPEPAAHASQDN